MGAGWGLARHLAKGVFLFSATLAGPEAFGETTAEFYQDLQNFDANGFPNDGTPLERLIGSFGSNTESMWEPPAPRPPGVGPTATRVFVSKYSSSSSWTTLCGNPCASHSFCYVVSVYFPDSLYTYAYCRQDQICGNEISVTISSADEASIDQPNAFKIRSLTLAFLQSHSFGPRVESSFAAFRAPAGAVVQPEQNLDAYVGGRDELELRTGPGGTLDLRAFSASNPVLTLNVPSKLFADTILLSPGVSLSSLFAVPPTVSPSGDIHSVRLLPRKHPNVLGRGQDETQVSVLNEGNVQEIVLVSWSDTLGWSQPGAVTRVLSPSEIESVPISLDISGDATSCEQSVLNVSADPFVSVASSDASALGASTVGSPATLQMTIFADEDLDGDGYENSVDDCYAVPDPSQSDSDQDFEGDRCDLDDGLIYVVLPERDEVRWQQEQGFDAWNVYRGSLDALRSGGPYTQTPESNALAARTCGLPSPPLADFLTPGPAQAAYYMVTGVASGIEGGLGADSAGQVRPNANPCP